MEEQAGNVAETGILRIKSNARDKNTEECLDGLLSNTGHGLREKTL